MSMRRDQLLSTLAPFAPSRAADLVLCLPLFVAAGCQTTASNDTAASTPHTSAPAKSEATAADKEAEAKTETKEKIEKKEHELACARLELDIAKQSMDAEERDAHVRLIEAQFRLQRATEDRDNYKNVETALATGETDLRLDEAKQRLEESRQELSELEKMYKNEKFAEITKELVLTRGKMKVTLAERGLALAQKKAQQQREFEMPKKLKELTQATEKAQEEVTSAQRKEERVANEKKLKLMKSEQSITEIERAIAKLKAPPKGEPTKGEPTKGEKDEKEAKS